MDFKDYAKQLGKRGGNKTKEKYGVDHYKRIGIMGATKRWKIDKSVEINGKLYEIYKIDFASGNKDLQTIVYTDEEGRLQKVQGDYPIKYIREKT